MISYAEAKSLTTYMGILVPIIDIPIYVSFCYLFSYMDTSFMFHACILFSILTAVFWSIMLVIVSFYTAFL